jgi:K+-sensing histidine kinase KdpD
MVLREAGVRARRRARYREILPQGPHRAAELPYAARQVDDQMRAYMETQAIPGPWPAAERLLVSISPSPLAERLVRAARRLADELNAEWLAIYVETPDQTAAAG